MSDWRPSRRQRKSKNRRLPRGIKVSGLTKATQTSIKSMLGQRLISIRNRDEGLGLKRRAGIWINATLTENEILKIAKMIRSHGDTVIRIFKNNLETEERLRVLAKKINAFYGKQQ